jgi:hypothetical protein
MPRNTEQRLAGEARRLKSAEANVVKAVAESDSETLTRAILEFVEAKKKILTLSADLDVALLHD